MRTLTLLCVLLLPAVASAALPLIPADFNYDWSVDLQDFGVLKDHFGMTQGAYYEIGDANNDGAVNLEDFGILKDNFGRTATPPTPVVTPEPCTLAVLGVGAFVVLKRRTR